MSFDISRISRAVSDLSVGSLTPFKLSHAQQISAAAFGFKSLAAYQAAKKLESPVDNNSGFVIIESELLADRARDLNVSADGTQISRIVSEAIRKIYPAANIHYSSNLRPVIAASAIADVVGLNPILAPDFDDARYQVIENSRGDEQGFLFKFDEPEWGQFAEHIRARHGSLHVFVPASFRRIVKGCSKPERFYLHGDQHEENSDEYFCRACDRLMHADHFDSDEHKDHGRRYFNAVSLWDRAVARWKLPLRRPINAPNLLAIRAQEGQRSTQEQRGEFHRWIETQIGQSGEMGNLAKDIMGDANFPTRLQTRDELVDYVEDVSQWGGLVDVARDAWRRFLASRTEASLPITLAEVTMGSAEYVAARSRARVRVDDIWRAATGVTSDQDWIWRNGREPVPAVAAARVNALLTRIEAGARDLLDSLRPVMPAGCSIAFDEDEADLVIQFSGRDSKVKVERRGVDRVSLAEIYEIPGAAVFLRVRPGVQTMPMIKQPTWVLWRGSFVQGAATRRPMQNYPNLPSEELLRQVLKRWL